MNMDTVTLLAGGDIGPRYEPTDQFAELVLPVLRQADLRFAQCERVYSERAWVPPDPGQPSGSHGERVRAHHPRFASIWKTAGIDVISLASNHTMDWGPDAMLDTMALFRGMGKRIIGAGKDEEEARKPAVVECNGVKIAFLGYCSVLSEGQEAGPGKAGCTPMRAHTYYQRGKDQTEEFHPGTPPAILTIPFEQDLQALQADIRKAKQQADAVVMSIHWGIHAIPKALATYQPVVAHAAIDAGADLILGHHPHCLKAVEVYKGKVCFYSLGNFIMTGNPKTAKPSAWNLWNLYYYRVDPEYLPPRGIYTYPPHSRMTMIAKAVFSKKGIDRISFLPAFINPQAQPAVVASGDPKFEEILEYVEWLSDQHSHTFRVDGGEIVVRA